MLVSLDEVKTYLRVDYGDEDSLLSEFIGIAEQLCLDVLRTKEPPQGNAIVKGAIYYAVGYLNENRGPAANMKELTEMLKNILSSCRNEEF